MSTFGEELQQQSAEFGQVQPSSTRSGDNLEPLKANEEQHPPWAKIFLGGGLNKTLSWLPAAKDIGTWPTVI